MEIAQDEYQKRRHIFEFCNWINEKLYELELKPNFEELYFEKKGNRIMIRQKRIKGFVWRLSVFIYHGKRSKST